jgi:high-affinity nickel-transport protein
MFNILLRLINDSPKEIIQKIKGVYAFLIIFNILAWVLALISFHQYPKLLAVSLVSYGFGLRHAVDADHIAIIDNVTRKLMQDGKRPVTVGLFFSFGHSVIVLIMSAAIVLASATIITTPIVTAFANKLISTFTYPIPQVNFLPRTCNLYLTSTNVRVNRNVINPYNPSNSNFKLLINQLLSQSDVEGIYYSGETQSLTRLNY